jgi:23S rRNA (adenine1618-N6)-methyltransferase
MIQEKKQHPKEKLRLHPRNRHRERYDFKQLIATCPELAQFVKMNIYNDESINFADPKAVIMLNKALLKHYYNIDYWDIPKYYLCPPIPGRADYLHYMADLMGYNNFGKIPTGDKIRCLDIGIGSNCVYSIIGIKEYGWSFIGSEIDAVAIESANKIIEMNPSLRGKVEIRMQKQRNDIFFGILYRDEFFDLSICNPPFYASYAEATAGTLRKLSNLNDEKIIKPKRNFGGQNTELWCKGGEQKFIHDMVRQSKLFSNNCLWFSTLVGKQTHLRSAYESLKLAEAVEIKTIQMGQGNKSSRIVAWTFLSKKNQREWIDRRWK